MTGKPNGKTHTNGNGSFRLLDGFLYDELTDVIGFKDGTHALYCNNIVFVGDLTATSPERLSDIPGIGRKKIKLIKGFLAARGLALNSPVNGWLAARAKRCRIERSVDPAFFARP